jgi:hypothetical protein
MASGVDCANTALILPVLRSRHLVGQDLQSAFAGLTDTDGPTHAYTRAPYEAPAKSKESFTSPLGLLSGIFDSRCRLRPQSCLPLDDPLYGGAGCGPSGDGYGRFRARCEAFTCLWISICRSCSGGSALDLIPGKTKMKGWLRFN